MVKQSLKAITMITVLVVVGLLSTVIPVNGQSRSLMVADIPFAFTIGNQTLEPGEYRVGSVFTGDDVLRISGRDSNANAVRLTISIQASKIPGKGKLVFHRYGDQYFLTEVWMGGDKIGRQLVKSKRERALEREIRQLAHKAFDKVEIELVAALK